MLISRRDLFAIPGAVIVAGCAGRPMESLREPVPELLLSNTVVPGYGAILDWSDDPNGITPRRSAEIGAQQRASGNMSPNPNLLYVSGGGSDGAFGAGVLFGWTAAGPRPEFTIVTGISTGSLIAPFAFLGVPYAERRRAAYTEISGKDVYRKKSIPGIVGSQSVADSSPRRVMVDQYVTDQMLIDIAREHARGRRLLVGTTKLDAARSVVWDIGAIASSEQADRRQLIQNILVASASVPGVFPPVNIKGIADGKSCDEMHVDGGTSNQAFLFLSQFSVLKATKAAGVKPKHSLHVIRNGKVGLQYSAVKPKLASIVGKSISSLIKTQGNGGLYRMYANAKRDGITFRTIRSPETFTEVAPELFDRAYMIKFFETGCRKGPVAAIRSEERSGPGAQTARAAGSGFPWSRFTTGYTSKELS